MSELLDRLKRIEERLDELDRRTVGMILVGPGPTSFQTPKRCPKDDATLDALIEMVRTS